jgi:uncharacterized LabA/DUF88 family protein
MTRVCLFFDGRNFHAGMKAAGIMGRSIDMAKFAQWLVGRVAPDGMLWGAHYYTGETTAIGAFLESLEQTTGFFVHRKSRKAQYTTCTHCGQRLEYQTEKEVDTQMVADMIRLAAVGGFDDMVLMSGDADHSPGLEAVMQLGKRAWVGLWGSYGASSRIVTRSFGRIDLLEGRAAFQAGHPSPPPGSADDDAPPRDPRPANGDADEGPQPGNEAPRSADATMVDALVLEVRRAHDHFVKQGGYLGVSYFVQRWKAPAIPRDPAEREEILNLAVEKGFVDIETRSENGKTMKVLTPVG